MRFMRRRRLRKQLKEQREDCIERIARSLEGIDQSLSLICDHLSGNNTYMGLGSVLDMLRQRLQ